MSMSPKQIADLIDAHSPALLLYARQFCDAAEDVVQEAFLKLTAQRTWPADVVPWLYRVVRNAALDAVKTQRRREKRERAVARKSAWFVEAEVDGLDAEAAAHALSELPIELREAIVAHLWGGLTFEQIAELSGTAASTACRRYQAGIDLLREKLEASCPNNQK
jgi:RNA polymerase sigma factor (sigma-70 family)